MSIRDAFLGDVAANPDDDVPRLVFADWLEENGEPERAQFIRLQCRLAEMDHYDQQRRDLVRTEQMLLRSFGNRWAEQDGLTRWIPKNPLNANDPWVGYRRGFIEYAFFQSPGRFLTCAGPLSRRTPLRQAWLDSPQPDDYLGHERLLGTYSRLYKEAVGVPLDATAQAARPSFPEPEEFCRMVASKWFSRLRGFRMGGLFCDRRALEILLSAPLSAGLHELNLTGSPLLVGDALTPFSKARLAGTESLVLDDCWPLAGGLQAVLRWPGVGSLRRLSLRVYDVRNAMGSDVAGILSATDRLTRLQLLRLRGQEVGANGLTLLAGWSCLKGLRHLDLGNAYADAVDAEANYATALERLARSPHWGELRELNLDEGAVPTLQALEALLGSPNLATLRVLTFRSEWVWAESEPVQDEAAQRLLRCPHLADDVVLRLPEKNLSERTRRQLQDRFGDGLTLHPEPRHYEKWDDWANDWTP